MSRILVGFGYGVLFNEHIPKDPVRAQFTPPAQRTKLCVYRAALANRCLTVMCIALCIVAYISVGEAWLGLFMVLSAIISVLCPLNCNSSCCYDCSRNTRLGKAFRHRGVYLWIFVSCIAYIVMFWYSWIFWLASRGGHKGGSSYVYSKCTREGGITLLNTVFAFSLIVNVCLLSLNLFSICIIYNNGCFMNEVKRDPVQQRAESEVVLDLLNISSIGEDPPDNESQSTNSDTDAQQSIARPLALNTECCPYCAESASTSTCAPSQSDSDVTRDFENINFPIRPPTIGECRTERVTRMIETTV